MALEHLPDSRAATEQAIDLRLGLRTTLYVLGEAPERLLDHLRRAETLAQTLGDPLRLGQVYAEMGNNFWVAGEVDRAIVYGQRALALAATLGHVGLQARAHLSLGRAYYDAGDYARAVESLERNVAILQGDLLYERFGSNGSVAATLPGLAEPTATPNVVRSRRGSPWPKKGSGSPRPSITPSA